MGNQDGHYSKMKPASSSGFQKNVSPPFIRKIEAGSSFSSMVGNMNLSVLSAGQLVVMAIAVGLASWRRNFSDFFHTPSLRDVLFVALFSALLFGYEILLHSQSAQRFNFFRQTIQSQLNGPEGRVLKSNFLLMDRAPDLGQPNLIYV
jgi:type IV secretory pathway TrbL component